VPDPSPPRRRFRLLRWSLFGLALAGLGFLLEDWLSPWPRCTIHFDSPFSFGSMSPDGHFLATGKSLPQFQAFLGGGINPGGVGLLGGNIGQPMGGGLGGWPGPLGQLGALGQPGLDNPIQVWNIRTGKLKGTYLKESGAENHVFSPSFRFMAAWESNPDAPENVERFILYLVDLQLGAQKQLPLKGVSTGAIHFSPRENFLLVFDEAKFEEAKENKVFHLVNTATGKLLNSFYGTAFRGFVPDESLIAFEAQNGDERDLCIWNTRVRKVVQTPLTLDSEVIVSPDGWTMAVTLADGLFFLDLRTFRKRRFRSRIGVGQHSRMIFSPDGKTLVLFLQKTGIEVVTGEGIEFWDVASGKQRHGDFGTLKNWRWDPANFNDWGSTFCFVAFSPDSTYFALAADAPDGPKLAIWDLSSAALLWLEEPIDAYLGLAFTADSRFLIADPEGKAEILDPRTGQRHHRFNAGYSPRLHIGEPRCKFSRDLRFVTIHTEINRQPHFLEKLLGDWWPKGNPNLRRMQVAEATTGRELARLESGSLVQVLLSEDGKTLVTNHQENGKYVMRVWDLPLRPPLLLVIGIPSGLGLIVFLFSRWRAVRTEPAAGSGEKTSRLN
jgi:WD40 repeat protein